jgi:hypothetical protein
MPTTSTKQHTHGGDDDTADTFALLVFQRPYNVAGLSYTM